MNIGYDHMIGKRMGCPWVEVGVITPVPFLQVQSHYFKQSTTNAVQKTESRKVYVEKEKVNVFESRVKSLYTYNRGMRMRGLKILIYWSSAKERSFIIL